MLGQAIKDRTAEQKAIKAKREQRKSRKRPYKSLLEGLPAEKHKSSTASGLVVVLLWKDPSGNTNRKARPWLQEPSNEILREWIEDYLDRLSRGYQPPGFRYKPIPHAARVMRGSVVLAEWIIKRDSKYRPESLATAPATVSSGGSLAPASTERLNTRPPQDATP